MIKTIIKAMYSAFVFIVLVSITLAGWTTYSFVFQSSKSNEISKVMQDLYDNQKSVAIDVIDLSKLLIKDTSESIVKKNNNLLEEKELLTGLEDNLKSNESPTTEDNGDNPLGIVIEPSLPEVSENRLPEIIEESLGNEQNEFSINKMEMDISK